MLSAADPWQAAKDIRPLWAFLPVSLILLVGSRRFGVSRVTGRLLGEGQNKGLFGPKRIRISPESFLEAGEFQTTSTDWRAIEQIAVTPQAVYVYNSAVSAFIVPRRCFLDEAAFEEFVRLARQYKAGAGG